jgi:hypothetical protein
MSKMGSHDPFGHFKHKLWPKKGLAVKLPTTKFDSQPLKVKNLLDFLACKWHAKYRWKALDEGYNFALDLISIGGLHTKLWPFEVTKVPTLGILGVPRQNDIWVLVPWPGKDYTIRGGKVLASPESRPWWVLWVRDYPWRIHAPKAFKLHTNQLVVSFMQVRVNNWCLSFFLVPIPKLQHAHLPPKCYKLGSVRQLFTLPLLSLHTHIWVY